MKIQVTNMKDQYAVTAIDTELPESDFMRTSPLLSRDEAADVLREYGMEDSEIEAALSQASRASA
ncbi:MAG: hypothetical protein JO210_04285 [Acidobacteriaceae bacterium]|nr:hypothetical protein [Acidobacteriaceae bacterium]